MAAPRVRVELHGFGTAGSVLRGVESDLFKGPNRKWAAKLLTKFARASTKFSRRAIATEGFGKWPKLSPWTRAQTGRRKVFAGMARKVRTRIAKGQSLFAATFFRSPGNWTLTQHHDGFREPAPNKTIKITLKNPGLIGLKGKKEIFFKATKETQVPARPVWMEGNPLKKMLRSQTIKWLAEYNNHLRAKAAKRSKP